MKKFVLFLCATLACLAFAPESDALIRRAAFRGAGIRARVGARAFAPVRNVFRGVRRAFIGHNVGLHAFAVGGYGYNQNLNDRFLSSSYSYGVNLNLGASYGACDMPVEPTPALQTILRVRTASTCTCGH